MREAVDFLLSHVERHGDTVASEKARQHRVILADDPWAGTGLLPGIALTREERAEKLAELGVADATGEPGKQAELETEQRATWDDEAQPAKPEPE